jgi:phenylpyruvate tautomerase PptA (4-oxalocrotonate tautomerase family)
MSDLLAIFADPEGDAEILVEIARLHPSRVTVLIEDVDSDWALDESASGSALRDRLARLIAAIERETGAVVTGLAGSRAQLAGWRFDREVGHRPAIA